LSPDVIGFVVLLATGASGEELDGATPFVSVAIERTIAAVAPASR
jgi:hypothetical protein